LRLPFLQFLWLPHTGQVTLGLSELPVRKSFDMILPQCGQLMILCSNFIRLLPNMQRKEGCASDTSRALGVQIPPSANTLGLTEYMNPL
jgi:hypothetical protein